MGTAVGYEPQTTVTAIGWLDSGQEFRVAIRALVRASL